MTIIESTVSTTSPSINDIPDDGPSRESLENLQNEIKEGLPPTPTIKEISYSEALLIIKKTILSEEEKNTIYKLQNSTNPTFNYHDQQGVAISKEYICIHGSASNDQILINAGMKNADFAYSIMSNGAIFQYFDPQLGSAGVGSRACFEGDPMINAKGIGIEFSVPMNKKRTDTEEPNLIQQMSGKTLIIYLKKLYNIAPNHITTSANVVTQADGTLIPGSHCDTFTRNKTILQAMGINIDSTRGTPTENDIQSRILLLQSQIDTHPNHPLCTKFAKSIEFRQAELKKIHNNTTDPKAE